MVKRIIFFIMIFVASCSYQKYNMDFNLYLSLLGTKNTFDVILYFGKVNIPHKTDLTIQEKLDLIEESNEEFHRKLQRFYNYWGIEEIRWYKWFKISYVHVTRFQLEKIFKYLGKDIQYVELDHFVEDTTTNAQSIDSTFHPYILDRYRIRAVWEEGYTGKGTVIGFIDTGVDALHPQLEGKLLWFADMVDTSNSMPVDPIGHGTHVVGTALGGDGLGPMEDVGLAPDAKYIMVRALDDEYRPTYILSAFDTLLSYVYNGGKLDVLSCSWGGWDVLIPTTVNPLLIFKYLDIPVVFAAGNVGLIDYETINSPALFPYVIAVGSIDSLDRFSMFSAIGPPAKTPFLYYRWLWYQKTDDYLKPDFVAYGSGVLSSVPGDTFAVYRGTSMATPQVAAAIAILKQLYPDATADEIYEMLCVLADRRKPNVIYGNGKIVFIRLLDPVTRAILSNIVEK